MNVTAWIRAARLPAQANIAPPLLLGLVLAWRETGSVDTVALVAVFAFGLFDQLTIVFANDWSDRETDATNTTATPFSGGSRVLVEGTLRPGQLARAAMITALAAIAVSAWLGPACFALGAVALGLLWLYCFAPARLSYRGGGELLQAVGVGAVLPLYGWAAQGVSIVGFPWWILGVSLPISWANAVATALPDEPSDRVSRKRTAAVQLGSRGASVVAFCAILGGLGSVVLRLGWATAAPLIALPAVTAVTQLGLLGARPGTRAMLARVLFGMLTTLATFVALTVHAWPG